MTTAAPECETETEAPFWIPPFSTGEAWTMAHRRFREGEPNPAIIQNVRSLNDLAAIITGKLEQALRINRLEARVNDLAMRVEQLEKTKRIAQATITTFAPEPYMALRGITVSMESSGNEFTASFYDACIHASGDNEQEAFDNLRDLMLDIFESLTAEQEGSLGPEPARQLSVLRELIRPL